jgi:hypothetical protein
MMAGFSRLHNLRPDTSPVWSVAEFHTVEHAAIATSRLP